MVDQGFYASLVLRRMFSRLDAMESSLKAQIGQLDARITSISDRLGAIEEGVVEAQSSRRKQGVKAKRKTEESLDKRRKR